LFQIIAYHVDSTTLADGTYELILEPEQGISEDQVNVVEELTEVPNQSSEIFNIPDCHTRFIMSHPIYKNINRAIIYAPGLSHAYIQQIIKISQHMSRVKTYKL
jgi:hypothetical protein